MKEICRTYKQKVSGNKEILINRIYNYLRFSHYGQKIQACWRGYLYRKYYRLHGPAVLNRKLCVNETDFFTLCDLKDISYTQFFSYKDEDNFIYGFDLVSFYTLIRKSPQRAQNPYNRKPISQEIYATLRQQIRLSHILKLPINLNMNEEDTLSPQKRIAMQVVDLFQAMDNLGNYTNSDWFLVLNRVELIQYIRQLIDIWSYRAQLSQNTMRDICPPSGTPFYDINMDMISTFSRDNLKKIILGVMRRLVLSGVNQESQTLGTYYVLAALTLVNEEAAAAMPWLYQSVAYVE